MDEVETTAELRREVASLRVANLFVTERNAELAEANEFLRRAYSEQFAEIVAMRAQLGVGMRLLDLFCGAGGAAMGYHRAGFEVVGVDINPQPHYPFKFHQADALEWLALGGASSFDVIHTSPPCQRYSRLAKMHPENDYPDLIGPTRDLLISTGLPYVIENVPGAPLDGIQLCGTSFGLGARGMDLRRHRLFESNMSIKALSCHHQLKTIGVYGHGGHTGKHRMAYAHEAREAMGIDWMNRDEMTQAIPPAYTEHIGRQLMALLQEKAA